jgi:DNA-directed RNA polymerase specialized sigma54-like protein
VADRLDPATPNTLSKVSQAIVDYQTRFLDEGPEAIEPLKMQQIADQVGVHVTTVSRAVDDKWIQTPRGIMPLKRFFVGGTERRRRRCGLGYDSSEAAGGHRPRGQDAPTATMNWSSNSAVKG